jgi:UDP-2,3-diacylglucosamine pyrophosphatase LpxH
MADGTTIYYLTGNHDETLRKFCDTSLGNLHLANKLVLELDGKKAWFFHGDVFDVTMKHSKWLAKLGAKGYDTLIVINSIVNYISKKLGKGKISLSQKIKNGVKGAVSFISDFEETAISIAKERNYEYVICGHIHQPIIKKTDNVTYLNSGDWVENLTALEWNNGKWDLYKFNELNVVKELEEIESMAPSFESLFQSIIYPS